MSLDTSHLRGKGHRITPQLQNILSILTHSPQNISQIMDELSQKRISVDRVTVYRTLDRLITLGMVHKIQLKERSTYFELASPHHHHHIVCDSCGKVEDVVIDEKDLLQTINTQTQFNITSHTVEFFGLCMQCQ